MRLIRGISRRRVLLLTLVSILLIAAASGYIEFFLRRPVGDGAAGPPINREDFSGVWTDRPVLLLGVGDSIMAGFGARTPAHGCFQRIIRNPADELPDLQGICLSAVLPNLEAINLSVSGTTSLAHLEILENDLPVQDPDMFGLVLITTGGNDLIHNYGRTPPKEGAMYGATIEQARPWIAAFEIRLEAILRTLNDRLPGGCEIFLADIYDPTDGVGDAPSVYLPDWPDGIEIHTAYNDVIHRCAARDDNVHLVPLYDTFLGHGSHCRQFWRATYCSADPHYWYFDNIEDPNDRGHDAIRRVFLNTIAAARKRFVR